MDFNVGTAQPREVTISGRRVSDNALIYSRVVYIDQSSNSIKSVSTNTLLTLGKNGVPSSPFDIYFTIKCNDHGITMNSFNTTIMSAGIVTTAGNAIGNITTSSVINMTNYVSLVTANSNLILSLPDAGLYISKNVRVKRIDTNATTVTVNCQNGQTIDNLATVNLTSYQALQFISNGVNWFLI